MAQWTVGPHRLLARILPRVQIVSMAVTNNSNCCGSMLPFHTQLDSLMNDGVWIKPTGLKATNEREL